MSTAPIESPKTIILHSPISPEVPLFSFRSGQELILEGTLIVARDQAHRRLVELIDSGKELPFDPVGAVIYYMGPSPPPPGKLIGAAGPTTSGRMDAFTIPLLERGVKALLGKGRRSQKVQEALLQYGALYLAAVGGAGAFYGSLVTKKELLAWPELGPEALLRLEVKNFPCLIAFDLFGSDLYSQGPLEWKL
ncbi:MAG: FumA C-terminus/TtdB family hydratase beta subunit [Deltaproteobacteria bacterium]|jgi:fumarate hydratase subunit beta|nr:FumA C-terminus/TtdB family hydratase beta subunit [Deltaproteobacteria bacterium]